MIHLIINIKQIQEIEKNLVQANMIQVLIDMKLINLIQVTNMIHQNMITIITMGQ